MSERDKTFLKIVVWVFILAIILFFAIFAGSKFSDEPLGLATGLSLGMLDLALLIVGCCYFLR